LYKNTYVKISALVLLGLICGIACQKTVSNDTPEVSVSIDGQSAPENSFSTDSLRQPEAFDQISNLNNPGPRYSSSLQNTNNFGRREETPENPQVRQNNDTTGPRQVGRARIRAQYIADGVRLYALTDDGKSSAVAWAYHGDKIAFIRDMAGGEQRKLLIMNSDGTGEEDVTPIGYPYFAEWSWKSDKLVYEFANRQEDSSQSGVFVYDLSEKKTTAVSTPYPLDDLDADEGPFWSADDRYVAYVAVGAASRRSQVWVANAHSGRYRELLPERGRSDEHSWSLTPPNRLSFLTPAGGGSFDVATSRPGGQDLVLLTDIGAEAIEAEVPKWSPTGEWVAYISDEEMTREERDRGRKDCWIARPDGSQKRNLTKATSPATELQINLDVPIWSWDGRWIVCEGYRYDIQGKSIPTLYLIDPVNGGYETLITFNPREKSEVEQFKTVKWSYDSTKIALFTKRQTVRNWGPETTYERLRTVLRLYDLTTRTVEDLLVLDEELDRKGIPGGGDRDDSIVNISWSPDSRSILLTIADIVSKADNILQPDIYRLALPSRFISETAALHNGPPTGRPEPIAEPVVEPTQTEQPPVTEQVEEQPEEPTEAVTEEVPEELPAIVTEIVAPQHMPVEEAMSSIPSEYGAYVNLNPTRNVMLFKGPPAVLQELRSDLEMVDVPPPHVLVDLLAVELTDEANRNLGLDWTYAEGHFAFFQPVGDAIRDLTPDPLLGGLTTYPGVGQAFYQGVGTLPSEFFIRLNTLVLDGEGTILANPRTVAMSGKESMIQMRKTLNYFFNEGYDTSGRPVVKKSDISADTEGRITPTLLANGKIHLMVDIKVGSFTFTAEAGLPEQTNRQSTTEVTVQSGETIVIGGLRQQEMSNVEIKVPLLGDIPLLGWLFKKQESIVRHSVLTIFITPRIMTENNPRPDWSTAKPDDFPRTPIMDNSELIKIK